MVLRALGRRQKDRKRGAGAWRAPAFNGPALSAHDRLRNRQSEPATVCFTIPRPRGAVETLKNKWQMLDSDSNSLIFKAYSNRVLVLREADPDLRIGGRILDGIV